MTLKQIAEWSETIYPLIKWGKPRPSLLSDAAQPLLKSSHGMFLWWDSLQTAYWNARHAASRKSSEGGKK